MPKRTFLRAPSSQSVDYVTGNCMTCASLMRWPKVVKEFRCTICDTVNYLAPLTSQKRTGLLPVNPISLDHTKKLVYDCIRAHLVKRVCNRRRRNYDNKPISEAEVSPQRRPKISRGSSDLLYTKADGQAGGLSDHGPRYIFSEEPTLHRNPTPSLLPAVTYSTPLSEGPSFQNTEAPATGTTSQEAEIDTIFRPVRDYLVTCFQSFESVSSSFLPSRSCCPVPSSSEQVPREALSSREPRVSRQPSRGNTLTNQSVCEVDPKLLLLGDVAKNGTWWLGGESQPAESSSTSRPLQQSPEINWGDLSHWYSVVTNPADSWPVVCAEISQHPDYENPSQLALWTAEQEVLKAQIRLRKTLLKITENLLKRPGGQIRETKELRFFLILLENPLLHSDPQDSEDAEDLHANTRGGQNDFPTTGPLSGRHSRILKRIIGLISNLPPDLHTQLAAWWSKYQPDRFSKTKDLVFGFLTYRLLRQRVVTVAKAADPLDDFNIPDRNPGRSSAALHNEIVLRGTQKNQKPKNKSYEEDWQIKAAARVLALLFDANNPYSPNRMDDPTPWTGETIDWRPSTAKGIFLPMSDFYNSLTDNIDLTEDFTWWEKNAQRFSFCQYPFLLSIWAKTQILEYDMKQQKSGHFRDEIFASIGSAMQRMSTNQYLVLRIRRECLVEDSLKSIGESIGSVTEDVKKPLRVQFMGEEGIDAGGPRKEWFLLLVREVFSPGMGLFTYDEDSNYCYFNPYSFENTNQFFLVGAVLGLAIYNSIILDVPLPPFMFRKLLSMAPNMSQPNRFTQVRQSMRYGLDDLAQYQPQLARGLKYLLEYEGDVEKTFCRDFVIEVPKYDTTVLIPLCEGGETRPVTNRNRREYVDLYIRYLLDTAVVRQFEPFKRGFYSVFSGNAFSLFRPEEVELLLRGSDEQLDVATLRGVAEYENWSTRRPDGVDSAVGWFWEVFAEAPPKDQRKLLLFITGSDRLPAAGASLTCIRMSCLGDDCGRFPIARTCFNLLSLWKYSTKDKLRTMLWRAVHESEGFGLK